jgi:HSP20 family protein
MDREDITIDLDGEQLTIGGTRTEESTEDNTERSYHRVERFEGTFSRSFLLPDGVEADAITARYENGVLTVDVPKPAQSDSGPRQITID